MNNLHIIGLPRGEILKELTQQYPQCAKVERQARQFVGPRSKREVWMEQGAAIAYLASQYDQQGATILEIGACQGYSAAILALAAPQAEVTTLEPHGGRRTRVRQAIGSLGVTVRAEESITFFSYCVEEEKKYDLIFVDGDHKNIALDLPYWNLIKQDGLFLFHDYSPLGSKRECRPVFDALNHFKDQLGHPLDVLVADNSGVGMAGWYRYDLTEVWPPEGTTLDEDGYVTSVEVLSGPFPEDTDGMTLDNATDGASSDGEEENDEEDS